MTSNYRFMRSMVMFDLPVDTATDRRNYRKFVTFLKKNGFLMFQESIYVKLSLNESGVRSLVSVLKNNLPPKGNVAILTITEKQFASIECLVGEFTTDILNTDERYVEL